MSLALIDVEYKFIIIDEEEWYQSWNDFDVNEIYVQNNF